METVLFAAFLTTAPAQEPIAAPDFAAFDRRLTAIEQRLTAIEQRGGRPLTPQSLPATTTTQASTFYASTTAGDCAGGSCSPASNYRVAPFGGRFRIRR